MDKIKKPYEITSADDKEFQVFDNKLEILRFVSSVHSRIKDEISSDFTLSYLDEKQKEYIIEMTTNSYYMQTMFTYLLNRLHQQQNKYQPEQYERARQIILNIAGEVFKTFMIRTYMINVMGRNDTKNPMLHILAESKPEEEKTPEPQGMDKLIEKIKPNEK